MNMDETVSTLRFASTTKNIKNKAVINEDAKDALLRRFQEQIAELKLQLEAETHEENDINGSAINGNNQSKFYRNNQKIQKNIDNLLFLDENLIDNNPIIPSEVLEKLKSLEAKIIVGGENLIEKAELQEKLIAESEAELQIRRNKEKELKLVLEQKQAEILSIEDSYGTLNEEVLALNKKLKKVH
jgi:hypothetical protein